MRTSELIFLDLYEYSYCEGVCRRDDCYYENECDCVCESEYDCESEW